MSKGSPQKVKELQDIHVKEVSLVDTPAIRRKFVIIKSEDNMEDKNNPTEAVVETVEEQPKQDDVQKQEGNDTEEQKSGNAFAPVVDFLKGENTEKIDPVLLVAAAKTLYAAAGLELPQAVDKSEKVVETVKEDVEIAKAKSMTAPRMAKMRDMYMKMVDFMKEFDPEMFKGGHLPEEKGGHLPEEKAYHAMELSEAQLSKLADNLFTKMKPLMSKGGHLPNEKGGHKPEEKKVKKENSTKQVEEMAEKVQELQKQLSQLEAVSKSGTEDHTETKEVEKKNNIWSSII